MNKNLLHCLVAGFILFCLNPMASADPAPTGREIIDRQQKLNNGYHDERIRGQMVLTGTGGNKTIREFEFLQLEKTPTEGSKSIIKILKPADLYGTGLLSFQNKNRPDDQWLYLPAILKTKRIAGQGKSGRFIGSEFSYEDLIPPDADKYRYEYSGREPCSDGQCHVVKAYPLFADSCYSMTVSWISLGTYQNIRTDFYNKKGLLQKTASFENRKLVGGRFWRPFKIVMKDLSNGKKTELMADQIKIGGGLTSLNFTRRALER